ncbi:serine/threonine protein kinase [Minicystis rosea]|nr:serine/threonine protein kinase [Minicystis rosea]
MSLDPAGAPSTVPDSEEPRDRPTLGATSEQSLWRAATVAADYVGPPFAIAADEGAGAAAAADPARRYRIHEVLGSGGMGEVRLCVDEAIGREVAMKTLLDGREVGARATPRFFREVRVQGQLEHPSVVPVYDVGVGAEGRLFFTMRRVHGPTLAEVLDGSARGQGGHGGLGRRKLLEAFVRVCLVVDYAHKRGVLHRDLKPANIMLGSYGEVYVLDWGVAKLVTEHATEAPVTVPGARHDAHGGVVGTPGYMSPEQVLGLDEAQGPRTDVYALGAILYEILTLRPLHRDKRERLFEATLAGVDARASAVAADVPPELDEVCVRATKVDREQRFAGAREMAEAVERYLDGEVDVERRRALAADHVARAKDAARRAERLADVASAEAARAEAMRAVIQALALDAEQADARRLLVKLLIDVPEQLPPSVEIEIAEATRKARVQTARFGVYALLAWVATIPFAAWLGVREVRSVGATSALAVVAALYAVWMWRTGSTQSRHMMLLAALIVATAGALSCWLGPFVLAPLTASSAVAWLTFHADRRERRILMALAAVAMLVPFALELLGWVPRSFTFEAGTLVLHPRAVFLPEIGTTVALVYTSVTFCVLQPVLLGGLRDALSAAERKLFLHAWRLRQLAPEAEP